MEKLPLTLKNVSDAWELKKADNAQKEKNRISSNRSQTVRLLGEIGIAAEEAEIMGEFRYSKEGIILENTYRHSNYGIGDRYISIVQPCTHCGKDIADQVTSLAGIGAALEAGPKMFGIHADGKCLNPPAPPEPTIGERLEEIVREIAREEIPLN
jgi:hypothetical protein